MSRIILDVDAADRELRGLLYRHHPVPGVWGYKVGDEILKDGLAATLPHLKYYNVMVDLKHHDVAGRIARIVKLYASFGAGAPKFLTISGACSPGAIHAGAAERGTMDIIVTTLLSDEEANCHNMYKFHGNLGKAIRAGAQGITCPAWLLPRLEEYSEWLSTKPRIIATGVVSEGVNPRHHKYPKPPEYALEHGATHVVIGTEIIDSQDPIATLRALGERCMQAVPA